MKLIPLSQNSKTISGKYFAQVDDEDFDYLIKYNWSVTTQSSKNLYCFRNQTILVDGEKTQIREMMHRLILGLTDPKVFCDHKDGNGLNNQKDNLRKATNSQNQKNKRASGLSKYLGVNLHTVRTKYKNKIYIHKKWVSKIVVGKKQICLGRFFSEKEAALAYNEAAIKYHGEFARLNKIDYFCEPNLI